MESIQDIFSLEILSKRSEKLSELCQNIPKYFVTEEMKIPSTDEKKFQVVDNVRNYCVQNNFAINNIDGVRVNFTNGWASIRASNTSKNISFRAEAETEEGLDMLQKIFLPLIDKYNK